MFSDAMDIGKLKTEFLEHLEIEKGRSLKTVANYDRYLSTFLSQTGAIRPKDIDDDMLREYRLWLNRQPDGKGGTLKKKTQNYYLIALRAFLKYLRRRGIDTLSPERIDLAKVPARSLDLITASELSRLLNAPEGDDIKALRDRALLEILFSTGMRVSELASLNCDLDLSRDEFSVRGKGDKIRVVFLSDRAKDTLRRYLDKRADIDDALFIQLSPSGNAADARRGGTRRLTPRSIERLVKHYATKAGITRVVTPHVIRHSFATDLLQNGADIRSVQALLGHAHIATTQVYTHVTDSHLKNVHKQFHGRQRK